MLVTHPLRANDIYAFTSVKYVISSRRRISIHELCLKASWEGKFRLCPISFEIARLEPSCLKYQAVIFSVSSVQIEISHEDN